MTYRHSVFCSIALVTLVTMQGCQPKIASDKGMSIDEMQQVFASDFTKAFENNDTEAMQKLFHFEGTPKELQLLLVEASLGKTFLKDFSGKHKVECTDFEDYDAAVIPGKCEFDGKSYTFNLSPQWTFSAKTIGNAGFDNSPSAYEHSGATTVHKGRIVFCGAKLDVP